LRPLLSADLLVMSRISRKEKDRRQRSISWEFAEILRLRPERVSLGASERDPHLQAHAINHPLKSERVKPSPRKGTWRDGRGEGADVKGRRLGGGLIPLLVLPKVKLALRSKESVLGDGPKAI
jgi:hypothetical protein